MNCNSAIINNAFQILSNLSAAHSLENLLGSMPHPEIKTITPPINIDPKKLAQLMNLLSIIDTTGKPPAGTPGGTTFKNSGQGGGQMLPPTDGNGNPITYREWDVNPKPAVGNRDAERIVTGSDGSAYYTSDHYQTFTKIK